MHATPSFTNLNRRFQRRKDPNQYTGINFQHRWRGWKSSLTNQGRSITQPHSALGTFLGDETFLANRICDICAWWLVAQRIMKERKLVTLKMRRMHSRPQPHRLAEGRTTHDPPHTILVAHIHLTLSQPRPELERTAATVVFCAIDVC